MAELEIEREKKVEWGTKEDRLFMREDGDDHEERD